MVLGGQATSVHKLTPPVTHCVVLTPGDEDTGHRRSIYAVPFADGDTDNDLGEVETYEFVDVATAPQPTSTSTTDAAAVAYEPAR